MVHLSRIYTRSGDDGTTGLGDGSRRTKADARVASYGDCDELGAQLGVCALEAREPGFLASIRRVQNDLFDLGADLCVPAAEDEQPGAALRIREAQVRRLEDEIDDVNAGLEPLNSFVLSGGTPLGAQLHLARCVARRCERSIVALAGIETINAVAVRYVNRLSDWLFVMARHANRGGGEVLWVPGGDDEPEAG
ncbi:MAG: cob(I)yrinic acid a,c-diamide adenosyltransferase [Salinibacterium sp.]|nr:cob(I)yrinic acid a,c-diamide adenosyltransferase [Planctomycetota bacterium]MCB1282371.1 cob(I)yrinic acid a,c-diamide adenosyltransferase [Salinibacterium sp.]